MLLRGGGPRLEACLGVRLRVWEHTAPTGWVSGRVCFRPYPSTLRCCLKKSFAANLMAFSGVTRVRFTAAPGWRTTRGTENTLFKQRYRVTLSTEITNGTHFCTDLTTGFPLLIHLHRCPTQQSAKWQRGVERVA